MEKIACFLVLKGANFLDGFFFIMCWYPHLLCYFCPTVTIRKNDGLLVSGKMGFINFPKSANIRSGIWGRSLH